VAAPILVINDDQAILQLFQLLLEGEGYQVQTSLIAYEDVREVAQIAPSLIILDLKIGRDQQGLLLLEQLRLYRPTMAIPIILCTAAVQLIREQEETLRQKGIPVLYKPFDVDEVLSLVRSTLSSPLDT